MATTRSLTRSMLPGLLLGLPDELQVDIYRCVPHADQLVLLSITCKSLATAINGCRVLWQDIDFSLTASKQISDGQLAALLQRINAKECTTYLRLQYSTISGTGLLPLKGSGKLEFLDLRQSHGPTAQFGDKPWWDGEALVALLESLHELIVPRHVLLPVTMQPSSVEKQVAKGPCQLVSTRFMSGLARRGS